MSGMTQQSHSPRPGMWTPTQNTLDPYSPDRIPRLHYVIFLKINCPGHMILKVSSDFRRLWFYLCLKEVQHVSTGSVSQILNTVCKTTNPVNPVIATPECPLEGRHQVDICHAFSLSCSTGNLPVRTLLSLLSRWALWCAEKLSILLRALQLTQVHHHQHHFVPIVLGIINTRIQSSRSFQSIWEKKMGVITSFALHIIDGQS